MYVRHTLRVVIFSRIICWVELLLKNPVVLYSDLLNSLIITPKLANILMSPAGF